MLALLRERILNLADEDYAAVRDALIDEGVLGRGRGRGGSVFRAVAADGDEIDEDDDDFALSPAENRSLDEERRRSGEKRPG